MSSVLCPTPAFLATPAIPTTLAFLAMHYPTVHVASLTMHCPTVHVASLATLSYPAIPGFLVFPGIKTHPASL